MSKAILVIDMPDNCSSCPLAVETVHNYDACCITGCRIISNGKFSNCPLRPIPEKSESHSPSDYWVGYDDGFNTCLSEIVGT